MVQPKGKYTPGGTPMSTLANPLSMETGPMDSGEGHLLHYQGTSNPFQIRSNLQRSPIKENKSNSVADQADAFPNVTTRCTEQKIQENLNQNEQEQYDLTTDKERNLYTLLCKERFEKTELMKSINDLQTRIKVLENSQSKPTTASPAAQVTYETDEEELNKETGWILNRSKKNKKRKMSKSPLVSPEQKQSVEQLPTGSKHVQKVEKSQVLPDQERSNKEPPSGGKNIKVPRPPPVIITNCNNYQSIRNILETNRIKFQAVALNSGDIKLNVPDSDSYRKLTKALNEENSTWYSYEDKQTRQNKVIVKKLHASCKPDEIKECLLEKGYKINEVTQLLKRGDKTPLPLYMLSFERTEDIKKIYAIHEILHMKVQIEAVKKSKLIPQCKRCQVYGHTQNFCNKEYRCVKCVGKHCTAECTKQKDTPPKCVNCGEAHPANYRGCIVIKELQKIRNKTREPLKSSRQEINSASTRISTKLRPHQTLNTPSRTNPNVTYADATTIGSSRRQNCSVSVNDSNNNQTNKILQDILNRLSSQEEKQERALISILQRLTLLEKSRTTSDLAALC